MENEFDVAIIGGGPGGSSTATYLSRMGYKVAVFEKEKFPREHVGESLIPFCYYRLKDMGVLDEVAKFSTKKPGINFLDKDGKRESVWCFEKVLHDGAGMIFHTKRDIFDKALLDNARKNGAQIFEQHTVKEVQLENPEEVKLRLTDENGVEKNVRAKFLVDASGQHSFLSKKLGDKIPYEGMNRIAIYRRWFNNQYDKSLNAGMIKIVYLGGTKKGWIWVIPIGRNHLSIGITLGHEYVREQKKKFSAENWKNEVYAAEIAEATCLHEILKNSVPQHDAIAIGDYSYRVEKKYGDNYAMVGDSGAFLDPVFSSGLFVAMESAYRVSPAIGQRLKNGTEAGRKALDETYLDIEGGYRLIEKFVRLFYDPELLKFSNIGTNDDQYDTFLNAYNIFHYLMAGDFFSNHKKYSEFIDTLSGEKDFNRFLHYAQTKANEFPNEEYCHYTFEDIYGHLPEEIPVNSEVKA